MKSPSIPILFTFTLLLVIMITNVEGQYVLVKTGTSCSRITSKDECKTAALELKAENQLPKLEGRRLNRNIFGLGFGLTLRFHFDSETCLN